MEYIKVASTSELKDVRKKKVSLGDREILLANVDGEYYAVDNRCTHMGGSLCDGELEGSSIVCPRHGTRFDVRTGKVAEKGKILFIKVKAEDIRTYPVKVEGTDIFVGVEK